MAKKVTLKAIRDYLEMPTREFTKQWKELSDQDQQDLKSEFAKL